MQGSWTYILNVPVHPSGYYPSPEIASQGLMEVEVDTALAYAKHYVNARHIQGICRADNIASRRVMEKNGFRYLCQAEMPIRGEV